MLDFHEPRQEAREPSRPLTPTGGISRESSEKTTPEVPVEDAAVAQQPSPSQPPPPVAPEPAPAPALVPVPAPAPAPVPASTEQQFPPLPEASFFSSPAQSHIVEPDTELLAKYQAAQIEIERLRAALSTMSEATSAGLRQRTRVASDAGSVTETEVQTIVDETFYHQQEGVPLQVVVIIALGVFITTYLFF